MAEVEIYICGVIAISNVMEYTENNYKLYGDKLNQRFSKEAEVSLIGCILLEPKILDDVSEIVEPNDFLGNNGKRIYAKALEIHRKGETYDIVSLLEHLKADNPNRAEDDKVLAVSAMQETPAISNAKHYAEIIKKYSLTRQAFLVGARLQDEGIVAGNAEDEISKAANELAGLLLDRGKSEMKSIADIAVEQYQNMYSKDAVKLIKTGYSNFDNLLGGFSGGNLCYLAARPGVGKTAFALNLAINLAKAGKRVGFFCMEMGETELFYRVMAMVGNIPHGKIRQHDMSRYSKEAGEAVSFIYERLGDKLDINDKTGLKVETIKNHCINKKYDVVIIDYLQLITPSGKYNNFNEKVSDISRQLKVMASDLHTTVICLSQLSRSVETRTKAKPMLSDLRDSGSIEQDANQVIFLWEDTRDKDEGITYVDIAKNRNGEQGTVVMNFNKSTQKFLEIDRHYEEDESPTDKKDYSKYRL